MGDAWPGYGSLHGYDRTVGAAPGWRTLCAYAIDHPGTGGSNRRLGCARRWVVDPDAAFVDLLSTDPFHPAIAALAASEIIGGYPDGTYRPLAPVTRQAAAAILHRLAGSPPVDTAPDHTDVGADHPVAAAITWATETGVVAGYPDDTFRPTTAVTRQTAGAIFHRVADSEP